MEDKEKEYWWGTYRKIYRGKGCKTGYPRRDKVKKPIFHLWTSENVMTLYFIVCHGWWTHWLHIKMPSWLVAGLRLYGRLVSRKRKGP